MIFGDDGVIDMAQITTGYRFRIDRIEAQENYFKWYEGEFDSLWPPASIKNGLKLLDVNTDLIRMNVFAVCADFYVDSILSTMPLMISPDDALNAWLDEEDNTKPVIKALEKAVLHWSVTGMFVMGVFEGDAGPKVRAVSPVHFVAVVDPTDEEDIIGYNLVYTVEQFLDSDPNRYRTEGRPNRIMVSRFSEQENVNQTDTFAYSESGGGVIGELLESNTGGILGVFPSEPRDGFYGSLKDSAAAYMLHRSRQSAVLHEFSNPPVTYPENAQTQRNLRAADGTTEDAKTGSIDTVEDALLSGRRVTIPVAGDDMASYGYLEFDVEGVMGNEFVQSLADQIYIQSGVPPAAWGVHIGLNESGESKKIAMMRSTQRVKEARNEIEDIIPQVIRAMGAPEGEINFAWSADPATDEGDHVTNLLALMQAGIMDAAEVRNALGFAPLTEEQEAEKQQANDMKKQEMETRMAELNNGGDGNAEEEEEE